MPWEGHSNQNGKCQDNLATVTLQFLCAGNHRGAQKRNFFNLPKLGNPLQDPVGAEVNILKHFDLASCQNFSNLWSKPWHIFKKKERGTVYDTFISLESCVHFCKLKPIYIFRKKRNSSTWDCSQVLFFPSHFPGSRHQKVADYQRGNKVDRATALNSCVIGFVEGRIKLPYLIEDNKSSFLFLLI